MKAEDINHIRWIHDRLVYVYKENENVDFLIKLRSIIAELEALQQPKSCEGCVKRSTQYCPVRGLFIYTYDEFCYNKHERKIDER
jgi:hypothetical protein